MLLLKVTKRRSADEGDNSNSDDNDDSGDDDGDDNDDSTAHIYSYERDDENSADESDLNYRDDKTNDDSDKDSDDVVDSLVRYYLCQALYCSSLQLVHHPSAYSSIACISMVGQQQQQKH